MPDNFDTNPGAGGKTFASDEIAGIDHQRIKVQSGVEGVAADVSAKDPLPVIPDEQQDILQFAIGNNPDVDTGSVPEDIWPEGGLYPFPAAAAATTIVSDNAADTAAGTGARTIVVDYLLADFTEVNEIVTMNGLTPVALAQNAFRINRMFAKTAGSNGANVGIIKAEHSGPVTIGVMEVGTGRSRQAVYTAALNFQTRAIQIFTSAFNQSVTAVGFILRLRAAGEAFVSSNPLYLHTQGQTAITIKLNGPGLPLPVGTDVTIQVVEVTSNNTKVSGSVQIARRSTL